MADNKNILVYPAGTEAAFEIHQALRCCPFVRLFGAESRPSHAEFVFAHCRSALPDESDPGLIAALNAIIDAEGIDCLFPASDSALLLLSRRRGELHCELIAAPSETVEACLAAERPADAPGKSFLADCFTDRHGVLRLVSPRTRERVRAGMAVRTRVFPADEGIRAIAEDVNRRLRFRGAWYFLLRQDAAGAYRLLETHPGVAASMGAVRALGYNLPLLTLCDHLGRDVELFGNDTALLMDRAFVSRFQTALSYEHVYVDFDDTLIVNGKVNAELMAFLYQAKSRGKKLYLLSRHSTELLPELPRYAISPALFTEIILLRAGENKADFILPDSIFIDDSFAERKRVKEACRIPVFDLDMVESLLDWKE